MLSSNCLRLFGARRVFGLSVCAFLMLAVGAWASLSVTIDDVVVERDYILDSTPEVDGIVARLEATLSGAGWQTGLTIDFSLERKTAAGVWEPVVLWGGGTTVQQSSSIFVGATPQAHSWSAKFVPESPLAMDTTHRVAVQFRQNGDLLADGYSGERVLFHFTNTVSNDDPYNIRTAVDEVALVGGRRHALDTADDEALRGFPLRIDWQYRRWDAFSAFLPTSVSRGFTAEVRLRRQSTGEILQTRLFSKTIAAIPSFVTQAEGRRPFAATDVWEVLFLPSAQINSTLGDLFFEVTIRHVDKITTPIALFTSNPAANQVGRLNHANGTAFFGETETILTGFASISAGVVLGSNVLLSISGPQGYLEGAASATFAAAAGVEANGFLASTGVFSVAALSAPIPMAHPGGIDTGQVGGVRFQRGAPSLLANGFRATVTARLPQGLGFSLEPDRGAMILANTLTFANALLDNKGRPAEGVSLAGDWWFVEESKPVRFRVSSVQWSPGDGRFHLTSAAGEHVRYVRAAENAFLAAIPQGEVEVPASLFKPSNTGFYSGVVAQTSADFHVRVGALGDALLHAELGFGAQEFTTHFPSVMPFAVDGGGFARIEDDQVVAGGLAGVGPSWMIYRADCGSETVCPGPGVFGRFDFAPTAGELFFTPDGGLYNVVQTAGIPDVNTLNLGDLAWGWDCESGTFTHLLPSPIVGNLLVSGHFLPGAALTADAFAPGRAVGILHESGLAFGTSSEFAPVRPFTPPFAEPVYWAPGLNFLVGDQGSSLVLSRIGCEWVDYLAKPCNLLYARRSGITGTLEAVPGSFPKTLEIYGYTFDFAFFGQGFRDNFPLPELARTEGSLRFDISTPVGALTLDLENITFNCVGDLLGASIRNGPAERLLAHWFADVDIHRLEFRPSNEGCQRFLVAATSAHSTLVEGAFAGMLGLTPAGTIISREMSRGLSIAPEVTSRFALPGVLSFVGPEEDAPYCFTPRTHAYFSDFDAWAAAPEAQRPPAGWLNFGGMLSLAFYGDTPAHAHTTARRATNENAQLVFTKALDGLLPLEDGEEKTDYDPANRGFPADVQPSVYRGDNGVPPREWRIKVGRYWGGESDALALINFRYSLEWVRSLRYFRTAEPADLNIKVLTLQSEVTQLDGRNVRKEFTKGYDLRYVANPWKFIAFLPLDDPLNTVYNEFFGIGSDLFKKGSRSVDELLGDRVDPFLAELFGSPEFAGRLDTLLAAIMAEQSSAQNQADWSAADLRQVIGENMEGFVGVFNGLGGEGTPEMPSLVDFSLERVRNANLLTAAMGKGIYRTNDGWTDKLPADGQFVQRIALLPINEQGKLDFEASRLTRFLSKGAKALAEGETDADFLPLVGGLEKFEAKVKGMVKEREGVFTRKGKVFTALGKEVSGLAEALADDDSAVRREIADLVARADMVALAEGIADALTAAILDASGGGARAFSVLTAETLADAVRGAFTDRFAGAGFMREFQMVQRQYLHDWNMIFRETTDSLFSEANKVTIGIMAELLAKVFNPGEAWEASLTEFAGFNPLSAGRISGHSHTHGDSLRLLRFDGFFTMGFPTGALSIEAHFQFMRTATVMANGCMTAAPAGSDQGRGMTEISYGADLKLPKGQTLFDKKGGAEFKANLKLAHSHVDGDWVGNGLSGGFRLGKLKMDSGLPGGDGEGITIESIEGAGGFGEYGAYLAMAAGLKWGGWKAAGGFFFGHACSIEPLKVVDKNIERTLGTGATSFTGVYTYLEGWIPISKVLLGVPPGCWFNISAGVGQGFYLLGVDGSLSAGGKMFVGAKVEAACMFSASADATLTFGLVQGKGRFDGSGKVSKKLGICRFACYRFELPFTLGYSDGSWRASAPYKKK